MTLTLTQTILLTALALSFSNHRSFSQQESLTILLHFDNIFFNSIEHFIISGNLVYELTDHLPNFIIFNKCTALSSNVKVYKRDYSRFSETELIDEVRSVNWQTVFKNNSDPSVIFDSNDKISQIIDKHIPTRQLSRRELKFKSEPWITPAIKVSIRVKNNLCKKISEKKIYILSLQVQIL